MVLVSAWHANHDLEEIQLDGEPRYGTPSSIYGLDSLPLRFVR